MDMGERGTGFDSFDKILFYFSEQDKTMPKPGLGMSFISIKRIYYIV
jgi:hypothetical protein